MRARLFIDGVEVVAPADMPALTEADHTFSGELVVDPTSWKLAELRKAGRLLQRDVEALALDMEPMDSRKERRQSRGRRRRGQAHGRGKGFKIKGLRP
jgi:hypothetical protein